jgi:hypothetical protein
MVRRGTGFDRDQTWRQLLEERQYLLPLQLAPNDGHTLRIDTVTWNTDFVMRIPMKSPGRSEMMAPVGSDMMSPRA